MKIESAGGGVIEADRRGREEKSYCIPRMVSVGGGGDKEGDAEGETGGGGGREEKKPASFRSLGVCDQLAEACESLGWKTPTSIQVDAIPHAFKGHDLIRLAQTGSGKTAAFALPILQALLEKPQSLFA